MSAKIYNENTHAFEDADIPKTYANGTWSNGRCKVYENGEWKDVYDQGWSGNTISLTNQSDLRWFTDPSNSYLTTNSSEGAYFTIGDNTTTIAGIPTAFILSDGYEVGFTVHGPQQNIDNQGYYTFSIQTSQRNYNFAYEFPWYMSDGRLLLLIDSNVYQYDGTPASWVTAPLAVKFRFQGGTVNAYLNDSQKASASYSGQLVMNKFAVQLQTFGHSTPTTYIKNLYVSRL